jgi:hypothetical protein
MRIPDFLRATLISPEIVAALLPFAAYAYEPAWINVLVKPMSEGVMPGLSAAGLAIGMLAFNYKEGIELLSLNGAKKVLIDWPDYAMLKMRLLVAFGWCLVGAVASLVATWMVLNNVDSLFGVTLLIGGLLAGAVATATIALARFKLREILGE